MNKQFQSNLTDNDDIKLDQEVREVLYGLRENLFKLVYNKKEDVHYLEYKDSATLKGGIIFQSLQILFLKKLIFVYPQVLFLKSILKN